MYYLLRIGDLLDLFNGQNAVVTCLHVALKAILDPEVLGRITLVGIELVNESPRSRRLLPVLLELDQLLLDCRLDRFLAFFGKEAPLLGLVLGLHEAYLTVLTAWLVTGPRASVPTGEPLDTGQVTLPAVTRWCAGVPAASAGELCFLRAGSRGRARL